MATYLIRTLLLVIPTVIGLSMLIFFVIYILPGDAVDQQIEAGAGYSEELVKARRAELGLDRPVYVQYGRWVSGVLRGDFGTSFRYGMPVYDQTMRRVPVTLELAGLAMLLAVLGGIPLGTISAVKQDTWVDQAGRILAVAAASVPNFVLGTVLILIFAIYFEWQPPPGFRKFLSDPFVHLQQILPAAFVLSGHAMGIVARMTRSSMLEVLRQDFIRTSRAKGLAERTVIFRHALKNALIPVISVTSVSLALLLGGVVIVETLFSIPGLGNLTVQAVIFRDYPQVMISILFLSIAIVAVNVFTDLCYAFVDPRIRYR